MNELIKLAKGAPMNVISKCVVFGTLGLLVI